MRHFLKDNLINILSIILILALFGYVSPVSLLTVHPAVYHDDYVMLSPSVSFADNGSLSVGVSDSTTRLSELLGGQGKCVPGVNAGFHLSMGLWFKMVGVGIKEARMFVYIMGTLLLVSIFFLGNLWWGAGIGLAAALLTVLDPTFWYVSRTIRPETFTVSLYCLSACFLSIRNPTWRNRCPELAGLLMGIAMCGHPVGAAASPVLITIPFVVHDMKPPVKYLMRFWGAILIILSIYMAFIFINWSSVMDNITLHNSQRSIGGFNLWDSIQAEFKRYSLTYGNSYSVKIMNVIRPLLWIGFLLNCISAVILLKRSAAKRDDLLKAGLFSCSVMMITILIAILGSDKANYLYLVNLMPWLYISSLSGYLIFVKIIIEKYRYGALKKALSPLTGIIIIAIITVKGAYAYQLDLSKYVREKIAPYEKIEQLLSKHIDPGSLVISNENSWLAVRNAQATYVFNKQYVQWLPQYARYPVQAVFDGSHLVSYSLDMQLINEIHMQNMAVYYITDMWDWAWNIYYPYGRYANSYKMLMNQLEGKFYRVCKIYTKDRGYVTLWRYKGATEPPLEKRILYYEGEVVKSAKDVIAVGVGSRKGEIILKPVGALNNIAIYRVNKGELYWLHLEMRSLEDNSFITVAVSGNNISRFVDAKVDIPIDYYFTADNKEVEVSLAILLNTGSAYVKNVFLKQIDIQ